MIDCEKIAAEELVRQFPTMREAMAAGAIINSSTLGYTRAGALAAYRDSLHEFMKGWEGFVEATNAKIAALEQERDGGSDG